MANILISGGSGLIGRSLVEELNQHGHQTGILTRSPKKHEGIRSFYWDPLNGKIDPEAISFADQIIHLAGESVGAGRWTRERKKALIDSRVESARLILQEVKQQEKALKSFVSSSAIGYYGSEVSENIYIENDPAGDDFQAEICIHWEAAADAFSSLGIRTVKIRTGIVLSAEGGALASMAGPINKGVGAALGSGKQYLPWIHAKDLAGIFTEAINNSDMQGAYNAVAPEHITNLQFTKLLAKTLNKKLFLPRVPALLLKLRFGEMSSLLLDGSRISSQKIRDTGFKFTYADLGSAFSEIYSNQESITD